MPQTKKTPPLSVSAWMQYREPCNVELLDAKGSVVMTVMTFRTTDYTGSPRKADRVWFVLPNDVVAIRVDDESATFKFLTG